MSGKPRRRSKQLAKAKGRVERSDPHAVIPQQQTAETPVQSEVVTVPPVEVSRKPTTAPVIETNGPFVLIELRRIGILAGIVIIVLVVLALTIA
jgi:hypothetical protein